MTIIDGEMVVQGFGLPEGPRYADAHLFVADASAGGVWKVPEHGGTPEAVVEHRRGIAGLALHASGGFVIGGRNLAWKRGPETTVLATVDSPSPVARFNDLTISPSGQVYVGSIVYDPDAEPENGSLVLVDLDGSVRTLVDDVELSNGMAFSPDGQVLYHVDSGPRSMRRYDMHPDGSVGPWSEVYRWDEGIPDGMAVAADGTLWVAVGDAGDRGFVSVLDPDGTERDRLEMPHAGVKSLCFGGEDGRSIFVAMGGDLQASRRDGVVVRYPVSVPGVPDRPARVQPAGPQEEAT